jgi:hypothetical protein
VSRAEVEDAAAAVGRLVAAVDPDWLSEWLEREVERRRRERYAMHASALEQLNRRLERWTDSTGTGVAGTGDEEN